MTGEVCLEGESIQEEIEEDCLGGSMRGEGLGGLREVLNRMRFEELKREIDELKAIKADVAGEAAICLNRGQPVTRAQAAAFLGVSTKKLQRMEVQGKLARCPDLGGVVLYSARDVLRLASASGRKEA